MYNAIALMCTFRILREKGGKSIIFGTFQIFCVLVEMCLCIYGCIALGTCQILLENLCKSITFGTFTILPENVCNL